MDRIYLKAYGKINLGLDVLRKREDGYHDVSMIMQMVSLYDKISIYKNNKKEITLKTNLYYLPTDEKNIAYKAAKLMMEQYKLQQGVSIKIEKRIPVAAGMAGGSTNAAAVLLGMNQLFDLHVSREELMELGLKLGADVPYCIMQRTALAEGIGEKLTTLPDMPKCVVLIAKPGISVSTKWVYENLALEKEQKHPDIEKMVQAIEHQDIEEIAENMGNILEDVTIKKYPVIEEIKDFMKSHGAINAMMSGSGPTVFGLYKNKRDANVALQELKKTKLVKQAFVRETINNKK